MKKHSFLKRPKDSTQWRSFAGEVQQCAKWPPIFYRPRSFPTELDFIVAKGFGRTLFYHILPDLCITLLLEKLQVCLWFWRLRNYCKKKRPNPMRSKKLVKTPGKTLDNTCQNQRHYYTHWSFVVGRSFGFLMEFLQQKTINVWNC